MKNLTIDLTNSDLARILGTVVESIREDESRGASVWLRPFEPTASGRNRPLTTWVCTRRREDGDVVFEINSSGVGVVYVYAADRSFDTHVLGKVTLRNVESKALEIYRIATATR